MENNLLDNLDFLLDEKWVESFFNENSEKIFGSFQKIKLENLKRAYNMAPESYNMLYEGESENGNFSIRASSSTLLSRARTYETMKFIYENGFSGREISVPKPLYYFEKINLMPYQNVSGPVLLYNLKSKQEELAPQIIMSAKALQKIHQLPMPNFSIDAPRWGFDLDRISHFIKDIDLIKKIISEYDGVLQTTPAIFCHGDYQPNNLIVFNDSITVIDFGAACLATKELDIASFVSQLEIMLFKADNISSFEYLKKIFLENYGDFNQEYYLKYSFYQSLEILGALISFFENDPNPDKTRVKLEINYWAEKINKDLYDRKN